MKPDTLLNPGWEILGWAMVASAAAAMTVTTVMIGAIVVSSVNVELNRRKDVRDL